MTTRRAGVVVASVEDPAGDVVEWAAAEAASSGSSLRLVHAFRGPVPTDALGFTPLLDCLPAPQLAAAGTLQAALLRARAVAPDIEVVGRMYQGSAARVLLRESRTARLLVLGTGGDGRVRRSLGGFLAWSAPARLAASADCPVTVVPRLPTQATGGPPPHVLVGVHATASSDAAVGLAFRAAGRRGIAVTAVHAWTADPPADLEGVAACRATTEAAARRLLARALIHWRTEFPDVRVTPQVACADAASALVRASAGAALVVIGARSRRHRLGAMAGSVGRCVVSRATAPVTIVGYEGRGLERGRLDARRTSER
jgi:nucleotide-binding universal stress UspA family protein